MRRQLPLAVASLFFACLSFIACSSGSDKGDDVNPSPDTTDNPVPTVPENTDSGKNNDKTPDNVTHNTDRDDPTTKPDNPTTTPDDPTTTPDDPTTTPDDPTATPDDSNTKPEETPTWKLVFEDDFEGDSSTPNPDYWSLAKKGDDTWNRHMSESYNQAYQKDGYLYLFGMRNKDGEYLTGGIETIDKFSFTYGQVKCRARFLRQPKGNHTGIWMMPEPPTQQWPRSGEIDIMEHLNDQDVIYETAHFWNGQTADQGNDDKKDATVSIDNEEFNVYGIIWDEKGVSFTINGEVKFTYSNEDPSNTNFDYQYPFTKPFYLILSQSLGGEGTWEGPVDNDELPAIFQIDWIKVWQKTE